MVVISTRLEGTRERDRVGQQLILADLPAAGAGPDLGLQRPPYRLGDVGAAVALAGVQQSLPPRLVDGLEDGPPGAPLRAPDVHLEDLPPPVAIGQRDLDQAVETPGSGDRGVDR